MKTIECSRKREFMPLSTNLLQARKVLTGIHSTCLCLCFVPLMPEVYEDEILFLVIVHQFCSSWFNNHVLMTMFCWNHTTGSSSHILLWFNTITLPSFHHLLSTKIFFDHAVSLVNFFHHSQRCNFSLHPLCMPLKNSPETTIKIIGFSFLDPQKWRV